MTIPSCTWTAKQYPADNTKEVAGGTSETDSKERRLAGGLGGVSPAHEGTEFFCQIPVDDVGRRSRPPSQVRIIKGRLPGKDSRFVLHLSRSSSHKRVDNVILDRCKANGHILLQSNPRGRCAVSLSNVILKVDSLRISGVEDACNSASRLFAVVHKTHEHLMESTRGPSGNRCGPKFVW